MATKLIQTKKTTLSYGINDSATTMRLVRLLKLDGSAMSASDIGDLLYGTFDPGTSREEIFSIDGANVTVNSDGTVDITNVVRGLKEVSPYNTGGFATDHPAGAVVIFGNNPQLFQTFASIPNDNDFEGENNFQILPTSTGGDATEDDELITYRQALELATGTANINRVVVAGTAGETITKDQLVYLKVSDGRWWLADADTAATVDNIILGLAQGAGTAGNAVTSGVLLFGLATLTAFAVTANTKYYASNTAGGISTSAGTTEVSIGLSQTTTTLLFFPRYDQVLTENQQDAMAGDNGTPSDTNRFVTQSGLQLGAEIYGASSGGTDTYAITLSPALGAYANGQRFAFKADVANTGPASLNINGLGAISIKKNHDVDLATGDIEANQIVEVIYNSTGPVFEMSSQVAQSLTRIPYLNIKSPEDGLDTNGQSLAFGCDMSQESPTYLWLATGDDTTAIKIYRLDKQTSGNYVYKGTTVTLVTSVNNNVYGVCETGAKVYVWYRDNSVVKLKQYDTSLGSPADITGFTTSANAANCMNSDPVTAGKLWVVETSSTSVKSYTISGTVATNVDSVTLSAGPSTPILIHKHTSGDIYAVSDAATDGVPNTIKRYNSTGTAQTDITTALFTGVADIEGAIGIVNLTASLAVVVAQKLDASAPWYLNIQTLDLP